MSYKKYLRLNHSSFKHLTESLDIIEKESNENFSSKHTGELLIIEILNLFHSTFEANKHSFLTEIFFKNQKALRLTYDHQEYIFNQIDEIIRDRAPVNRTRQIQIVNLYRNIVSDLYDPYLSIIVACLKLKEATFNNFVETNLSTTEFQKFEYAKSRLQGTKMFAGYHSLIRNAVSHTGTHSISYDTQGVTFKKIKRSSNPEVTAVLQLTNEELLSNLRSMIDFITAVNASINIFGLDAKEFILENREIGESFISEFATTELCQAWREDANKQYLKIWSNASLSESAKHDYFAEQFTKGCVDRELKAKKLSFRKKDKIVLIEVPSKRVDMNNKGEVIYRIIELIKYCLVAEPLFHFQYESYVSFETEEMMADTLQVQIEGKYLKDHALLKSNMYNLLDEGQFFKNKILLNLSIDFKGLQEIESRSLTSKKLTKQKGRN
ncbi:hypothetical protein [Niabella beijingensis]|uniref:hypothetical protein n=1 Tax=Niabella beijingensis TaxID=2872700 RepID=UPI001CBD955A|nr:hypothetical protein [Niabella beijingensis]MBZ4190734.1 hypothetical protein [Niabella beijingensis]